MPAEGIRASRLDGIGLSEIVQISERAAALRAEGRDVIALSAGEPDLPTPAHLIAAAHQAALEGRTRYTATAGTPELRTAIARRAGRQPAEVIVSTGAKQVLANAMLASLEPGDEVVMPAPFWTSYADIVRLAGGKPVVAPCSAGTGFKLTPEALAAALGPKTRWLMLNSPSNPTGAVYSRAEYRALAGALAGHPRVWLLADEIYRHLSYAPFTSVAEAVPELMDRTLIVDGVSKAWSMTGWRLGWGIGSKALISAMVAVQGQITSGASSISQAAALAALEGDPALLTERCAIFRRRRDSALVALAKVPGLNCRAPEGAFYVFPSCQRLLKPAGGPFEDDAALCRWLLDEAGVAVVPGSAFGAPGHLRISFAYAETTLLDGIGRIAAALCSLTVPAGS